MCLIRIKVKVPQMGWNTIYNLKSDLFKDIAENEYMYLVHSFYVLIVLNRLLRQITNRMALQKNNFTEPTSPRKVGDVGEKFRKFSATLNFKPETQKKSCIIPAIDIIDGKCVRLSKGDYSTKIIYEIRLKLPKNLKHMELNFCI
jgi:hypothetical protein